MHLRGNAGNDFLSGRCGNIYVNGDGQDGQECPPHTLCFVYFPMQKVLKIRFRMSSLVVAPVISSSGRNAL